MKRAKQRLRADRFCLQANRIPRRSPINLNMVLVPTTGKKIGEIARRQLVLASSVSECLGE